MADEQTQAVPLDSILNTTKKLLDVHIEDDSFDVDILTYINSTFSILSQMGVGPTVPLYIVDASTPWSAFTEGNPELNMARAYVGNKARLLFDRTGTSFSLEAVKELVKEFEWRLNIVGQEADIER